MIRPTGRNWWIFGLCAAVLVAAMIWLTAVMLRLDHANAVTNAESDHQIAMSKALWRMDSWLAPQLAREAARPYYEYLAYYPQRQAYTKVLSEIQEGEVLTPSALLTYRSEIFRLHFQLDAKNELSSPQVPEGNWRDLTQGNFGDQLDLDAHTSLLGQLRARVKNVSQELQSRYREVLANIQVEDDKTVSPAMNDYAYRARSTDQARQTTQSGAAWQARQPVEPGQVRIGPLLPIWVEGETGEEPWLLFVRQARLSDRTLFQGILADWRKLRAALLEQASDLFGTNDGAALERSDDTALSGGSHELTTVSARFHAPMKLSEHRLDGGTLLVLCVAWGGLLISLIAVGFALHSTNQFGQRRARFASAVTHELRTPLTTFRMYSEMLAEDMVRDPAQRTEYLNTLKCEADRLARLVENVLSYARIEDGRFNSHPERTDLSALLERIRPVLEQRTRETDQRLEITVRDGVDLEVDVDAIAQILFNLVDNACKYASGASDPRIEVIAESNDRVVTITVRDYGPGIPANSRDAIFRPFERAEQTPADNERPGVGLGLALARALAEDLGGRLSLAQASGPGATFALEIPRAARS